jgi:nucleoside 2-deoxyribosyltransferase
VILYLAARYTRKDEIREYAKRLAAAGHIISATWFDEPHAGEATMDEVGDELLRVYAHRDLAEIRDADAIVFYSETEHTHNRRGGRHVEFGYALGLGKRIIVVGPLENIFHHLPHIEHFADTEDVARML